MAGLRLAASAGCCLWIAGGAAAADDSHYQNQLLGERGLGMGGAFTAVATDPTASFYNPGALVMTGASSVSASLNVYGVEHRVVEGGFASLIEGELRGVDLENTSYPTVPTTFGVLRAFGEAFDDGGRRHALAFSMLVPDQTAVSYSGSVGVSGESDLDVLRFSESDRTLWVGPSYAVRVTDDLAVGISLFVEMRSYARSYQRFMETVGEPLGTGTPTSEYFEFRRHDTSFETYSLLLRLGALYRPLRDVRVGLTLGMPSIHLWGTGSVSTQEGLARFDLPDEPWTYGDFLLASADDLGAETFTPLEVRLGAAFEPSDTVTASIDVSYHLPTYVLPDGAGGKIRAFGPYDRVAAPADGLEAATFDPLFQNRVSRRGVLNLNAGFEWLIADSWPVRAGVFTNFSSAPPPSPSAASVPYVDVAGGTLSVGYRFDGFTINVGFLGSVGWGSAQAVNPLGGPPDFLDRDVREELFYFFVSGAQEIMTRTIDSWIG